MQDFVDLTRKAAHEMKEPLETIQARVDLLMSQIPEDMPPSVRKSLQDLKETAGRLAASIRAISRAK